MLLNRKFLFKFMTIWRQLGRAKGSFQIQNCDFEI